MICRIILLQMIVSVKSQSSVLVATALDVLPLGYQHSAFVNQHELNINDSSLTNIDGQFAANPSLNHHMLSYAYITSGSPLASSVKQYRYTCVSAHRSLPTANHEPMTAYLN